MTRPLPLFARLVSPFAAALGVASAGALLAACPTSSSTVDITPLTSIFIRSDSLLAGHGCGTGPGQVFRYVAIAENREDVSEAAGVLEKPILAYGSTLDCFADGVFTELAPADGGALTYDIHVYAFSQSAYDAAQGEIDGVRTLVPPGATLGQLNSLKDTLNLIATYTTVCEATQQAGVPVLARCAPLLPRTSDGGLDDGGDGGDDAGDAAEAGDDAGDAGDGGDAADAQDSGDADGT